MDTEKLLAQLVERMLKIYGRDVRAVVLYGSAATGDFHHKHSDLNVLCVLRELDLEGLEKAEPLANWWRGLRNPAPLLLSERELADSLDAFPIEFMDMREQHRVLYGEDPVATLAFDPLYHRVQVEHELRAKLLALRQRYLGIYRDRKAVLQLMLDALPSFSALYRHALILAGEPAPLKKREILEAAGRKFGFDAAPLIALLEIRQAARRPPAVEARAAFQACYNSVVRVSEGVNALEKKAEIR